MTRITAARLPLVLAAMAALAFGVLALARPATADVTSLSIVPTTQTVAPSATGVTVSLEAVATAPGIGAYDIDVIYNNTLLTVTGCTSNAVGVCNTGAAADTVNFVGASAGGLTGSPVQLGTITFDAGATEGTASIAIVVNTLTDPNVTDIPVTPTDGEVVIQAATPTPTASPATATPTTAATATATPTPPAQLPATGGSLGGGEPGVTALALIAAAVAVSTGAAFAYSRRRVR